MRTLAKHLTLGHGGWAICWGIGASVSHYGDTWKGHLHELASDAVGIDLTVIPLQDLSRLSICGPLVDNLLASRQILKLCAEAPVSWIDQPQPGKDARFGDASSLDRVSLDVYLTIARRFGARIFDPHQEGACTGTLLLKEQLYQQRISQVRRLSAHRPPGPRRPPLQRRVLKAGAQQFLLFLGP
jgi:hypothetical protein